MMWTCSKCGTKVEGDFEICWSCGPSMDGVADLHFLHPDLPGVPHPTDDGSSIPLPTTDLVTVATFWFPGEAHIVRCRLEAAGISVYIADEFTVTMDWFLSNAIGGIKLQVAA